MVLRRPELGEQPDDDMDVRAAGENFHRVKAALVVNLFTLPAAYPVAYARIGAKDHVSDRRLAEWREPQGVNGGAKADFCHCSRELLRAEVQMHANKLTAGISLTYLLERRAGKMDKV